MDQQLRLDLESEPDLDSLWSQVLRRVGRRVGKEALQSWLEPTRLTELGRETITVLVPNATAREWIQRRYVRALEEEAAEVLGRCVSVEFTTSPRTKAAVRPAERSSEVVAPQAQPRQVDRSFPALPINEDYDFSSFVVGGSNRVAAGAARAVAEQPGRSFNPLFIYGGVGLGKTHLLHAIGNALRQSQARARVAYISGETFTTHFVNSLRERREDQFRRAYRSVDVWLVDDIQFIADKSSTRQEFFHTFNELYLTNRQVVLASDRTPRELRLLEDRLRTRLESGLMVEIGAPDLETRITILQQRVEQEGAEVPPEVIAQIAQGITSSVRLLNAALVRVLALASLQHRAIDPELTARALQAYAGEGGVRRLGQQAVLRAVCDFFQIEECDLTGPRRDRRTVVARQVAMYLMRELMGRSLVDIGQAFGGKSHSTVLYALARLEKAMQEDGDLEGAVESLRRQLQGG